MDTEVQVQEPKRVMDMVVLMPREVFEAIENERKERGCSRSSLLYALLDRQTKGFTEFKLTKAQEQLLHKREPK